MCVPDSALLFFVRSFSLIMVHEKYSFGLKFPLLILVQKEQVETNPLCRIAMLWPSKAGVF